MADTGSFFMTHFFSLCRWDSESKYYPEETVPAVADHRVAARERLPDDDKKNGTDCYLMECTNLIQQSTPVMSKVSTPENSVFLTPISPYDFQMHQFQEAEKSLEQGQKLYQCRRCRGPVPSPVVSAEPKESRRPRRCNLISKMNLPDEHHPDIQQQERKKAKTLSTVSPFFSSPPVTVASLGEKMTHSLVLSSPSLSMSLSMSGSYSGLDMYGTPDKDIRRSTSCSSITGIDLQSSMGRVHSPINLSLDLSLSNLNTSGNQLYMPNLDLSYNTLRCSRSCCRHDINNSHFSDSSVSFGSESNMTEFCEFSNMVPSPVPVSSEFLSQHSIEQGRNFQDFSHSNGVISTSSFSFQHSDPNIEGSIVLECPKPTCGFRFCSNCEESEHSGRPCHVLSSDHMESFSEDSALGISSVSNKTKRSDGERSKENSLKKNKNRTKGSSNKSLRRIARL
ncbi:unnamed protein product [Orchesella dallaii]|uniref:C2H2-type domain-containing protein n=1 Tax=Orchesella dallaii TaxID=48710 RepID=A0ABP1S6N4_9HEXA